MGTFDRIPSTTRGQEFPMGDIFDPQKETRAAEWFEQIEGFEFEQFDEHIGENHKLDSSYSILARYSLQSAVWLCKEWDRNRGQNNYYTETGFYISSTFIKESEFLPMYDADFRGPLLRMKRENGAREFGRTAWNGMQRDYPRVAMQYDRLYEFGREHYELEVESNEDFFKAGLMLPYMLSMSAQLEIAMKEKAFTSWNAVGKGLQGTPFNEFFTAKTPLVSNVPAKRHKFTKVTN